MFKPQKSRTQGRHATETDPRRALGLKQSCDLLVAGGYFRAKMPTLSPFDRVVGGLVWCITASNVDVDVDILYEENSSIGERIRVSEQIVRSLQLMKCPFTLQSFQIQGLDYESILPILKWLIKQVLQTRLLTGNESRLISIRSFDHAIGAHNIGIIDTDGTVLPPPSSSTTQQQQDKQASSLLIPQQQQQQQQQPITIPIFPEDRFIQSSLDSTASFITFYTQQRKYKKRPGMIFDSIDQKVEATLLEYDDRHVRLAIDLEQQDLERTKKEQQNRNKNQSSSSSSTTSGNTNDDIQTLLDTKQSLQGNGIDLSNVEGAELQRLQESNRIRQLQGQLDSSSDTGFRINAGLVGSLVNISDDVLKAQNEYKTQDQLQQEKVSLKDQREIEQQRHTKQCDNLRRKINDIQTSINDKSNEELNIKTQHSTINESYQSKLAQIQTIQGKLKELDIIESQTENKELLAELKRLVILNEQIKKQEIQFKQSCKEQMVIYRQGIDELKIKLGLNNDENNNIINEETAKFNELQALIDKETIRLDKIKEVLYQRHLELLSVYLKIDEIPTRSELLQFEKRFIELYQITASKLIETRSYFTWYNTLSTTYSYLQQELTLLESILSNFAIGMKSEKASIEMQTQMKTILKVMEENIGTTEEELSNEITEESVLVEKYNQLMKKERDYYKLLKKFQLECDLNTKLAQQLEQLQ